MAGEAEQLRFDTAGIAMGNGDLVGVTDFQTTLTNGAKQKHTLRRSGAGIAWGVTESQITFNSIISQDGPEREYWQLCQDKKISQIRIKPPGGKVLTYNGAFKDVNGDFPLDDAVKISVVFVGKQKRVA